MTTFIGIDGSTITPLTRAGLMQHPAFADFRTDGDGNPCVWENHYQKDTHSWSFAWSCKCDDDDISPYRSDWVGPGTSGDERNGFYRLWESLPEAGNDNRAKTAAEVKKLIDEMEADPDFADIPKRPRPTLQTDACIREMERYEEKEIAWRRMMPAFCNEITQRSAPAWAWDMIDGLLGLGLGDAADLSAVAMKFATENPEYAEITREDAKRAAGVL